MNKVKVRDKDGRLLTGTYIVFQSLLFATRNLTHDEKSDFLDDMIEAFGTGEPDTDTKGGSFAYRAMEESLEYRASSAEYGREGGLKRAENARKRAAEQAEQMGVFNG